MDSEKPWSLEPGPIMPRPNTQTLGPTDPRLLLSHPERISELYVEQMREVQRTEKLADESLKRWQFRNAAIDRETKRAEQFAQVYGAVGKVVGAIASKYKSFAMPAKGLLIAQSIANTYAAAISQLKIPWPLNLFAVAATIASGVSSVNKIKEQKFQFGGPVFGPSHSQGGVVAELEGGEHVWSQRDVVAAGGHGAVEKLRKGGINGHYSIGAIRRHQNMTRQANYLGLTG